MERKRIVVGAYKVNKPFVNHNASYEVAAWWQDEEAQVGVYPLYLQRQYLSPNELELVTEIKAKVVDDYFPALWGGMSVSREPYKPKHIGQEATIRRHIEIENAVQSTGSSPDGDSNIFFHPDWWEVVKEEAVAKLFDTYSSLPKWWEELLDLNPDTFVSDGRYGFRMEYESKVGMIGHFGRKLEKWSQRLCIISRHEGYRGKGGEHPLISKDLYRSNTNWANAVFMQPFDRSLTP